MQPVGSLHSAAYPCSEQYQFGPRPFSNLSKIHFNIILPSTSECSNWSLFFSFSHQSPVCTSPSHRKCNMSRTSQSSSFARPNPIFDEEYRLWNASLCSLFHFPVTSSLLDPNILLSTLFSNTLSLCSSLNVSDRVSHPLKTNRHNYISLYSNLCISEYQNGRQKVMYRVVAGIFWTKFALEFVMNASSIC